MFIISVTVHDTNDMLHTAELNKRCANKAVMLTKEARGAFRKHTQYYKTFGTSCRPRLYGCGHCRPRNLWLWICAIVRNMNRGIDVVTGHAITNQYGPPHSPLSLHAKPNERPRDDDNAVSFTFIRRTTSPYRLPYNSGLCLQRTTSVTVWKCI